MKNIEIKSDGILTKIYVDGKEISGVRKFELEQTAGCAPVLKLEMYGNIEVIDFPCKISVENVLKKISR